MAKLGIIGSGYVGLVTAAGLAKNQDHALYVCDANEERVKKLKQGIAPIKEPGLSELLFAHNVSFFGPEEFVQLKLDVIFICVGTPSNIDGSVDVSQVFVTCDKYREVAPTIIIRSTVPAGTTRKVRASLELSYPAVTPMVVHHPEFLQQGTAIQDFTEGNRSPVFGVVDNGDILKVWEIASSLYPLPSMIMQAEASELSKYLNNAFLATKISFANQAARLCKQAGCDYAFIKQVLADDPRIGGAFLDPGMGYGGSCLGKDTLGLSAYSPSNLPLLKATMDINEEIKGNLVKELISIINSTNSSLNQPTLVVDGVTFKDGTDDIRNSVIARVLKTVIADTGANVLFVDALADDDKLTDFFFPLHDFVDIVEDFYEAMGLVGYMDIVGMVLSKSTASLGAVDFARSLEEGTPILDCRPTPEKRIMFEGLNIIPFVG